MIVPERGKEIKVFLPFSPETSHKNKHYMCTCSHTPLPNSSIIVSTLLFSYYIDLGKAEMPVLRALG